MNIYRKSLWVVVLCFCANAFTFAQNAPVNSQTTWFGPYSIHLVDNLKSASPKLSVTLLLKDLSQTHPKIRLRLHMDGFLHSLQTPKYAQTTIYDITPGIPLRLSNMDLYEYFLPQNLEFGNISKSDYQNNFKIPEDEYQVWFEVVEAYSLTRVSAGEFPAKAWFILNSPPQINTPAN
jgi:hypothetical protein